MHTVFIHGTSSDPTMPTQGVMYLRNLFLTMASKYKLIQCTLTLDDSSEVHSRE